MRMTKLVTAAAFALAIGSLSSFAAGPFEGKWKVQDTKGNPFEITLMADGSAAGSREGEGLKGTWKTEGSSAMINWESGWSTKITKEGDQYKKLAYEKGKPVGTATEAQKVE